MHTFSHMRTSLRTPTKSDSRVTPSNGLVLTHPPPAAAAAALRTRTCASSSSPTVVVESAPSNSNDFASNSLLRSAVPSGSSSSGLALSPSSSQQRWSQMWFEAMVQTVVKQLDGAPFILQVTSKPVLQMQLIRLDPAELDQGWEHVQRKLLNQQQQSAADAYDAVILVHPVVSEQQPCVVSQVRGQAYYNCPHSSSGSSSQSAATCRYDQVAADEMMSGRFGDCCNGEGHGQQQHQHQHDNRHRSQSSSSNCSSESKLAYYGLVVQCRDLQDTLQGCYLLKTTQLSQHHGGGAGCHCTHYSLNRVCQGPSLQQQFQASWLV